MVIIMIMVIMNGKETRAKEKRREKRLHRRNRMILLIPQTDIIIYTCHISRREKLDGKLRHTKRNRSDCGLGTKHKPLNYVDAGTVSFLTVME